eukprot:SAG31_NODE_22437_length_525_cov_1.199531_1_plen_34_part_10
MLYEVEKRAVHYLSDLITAEQTGRKIAPQVAVAR